MVCLQIIITKFKPAIFILESTIKGVAEGLVEESSRSR